MTITASIVLYHNDINELEEAVSSCLSSPLINTLYLIDNSATDELKQLATDSRIQYIHNPTNIGFGAAHNIAIAKAIQHSHYHLVCNPDVSFDGNIIETLSQFIEADPTIGVVMPKVLYKNSEVQRLCKLLPSPLNLFGRRFASAFRYFKHIDQQYELNEYQYDRVLNVPCLSGCFMFIRTQILKQVGSFDTRYFMYLEDVDLVRRIGQVSRTVCYPFVAIYHSYQKGSYSGKNLMFIHILSAIKYFNKWGWFFDREREERNQASLKEINDKR